VIEVTMSDILLAAIAVASAAMGGLFFAFSTFVMRALAVLPPAQGVQAMQSINVYAVTPVFMTALFGTAAACVAAAAYTALAGMGAATTPIVAGSATYLIGTIVVTIACNVPLNNALATADPHSAGAADFWAIYLRRWVGWNHVRTVSGIAAAGLFIYAMTRTP
jgi:uncharacterized membrane protein